MPDDEFWNRRYAQRQLGPGWWLADNSNYLLWLAEGATRYWLFAAKIEEYRKLGYDCGPETGPEG